LYPLSELEADLPADEVGGLAAVIIVAWLERFRYDVCKDFETVDAAGAFGRKTYREIELRTFHIVLSFLKRKAPLLLRGFFLDVYVV
jgi:hypothetical protein